MKGTLLIVEDQPNFREGLRMFIEQESIGWEVIGEAENGEEGMEKIKALQPDLVLMDIHMPVRNGIELAEWMFSNRIDTMFVIITGFQDFSYARSALRYGALDFLLKPCSDEDISRILLSAYDRLEEKEKPACPNNCQGKYFKIRPAPITIKRAVGLTNAQDFQQPSFMAYFCRRLFPCRQKLP